MLAIACPPPPCGDCKTWNTETEVCDSDCNTSQCCDNDSCVDDCPTGSCCDDTCCGATQCCDDGSCVTTCPGECKTCSIFGVCEDDDSECSSVDCEDCNNGTCEDRCPALGEHCWLAMCVQCRDILDCDLCEDCVNYQCKHPCDECYIPKYCGSACACVECEYGEEDTTTCSTANSTTECDCSHNIFNPCSSARESVVYSGNSLKSCTGPDCDPVDVLCYTTYQGCKVSESINPLEWCTGAGLGGRIVCEVMLGVPGPGCWTCVNSFEGGVPTNESQGDCPTEAWP